MSYLDETNLKRIIEAAIMASDQPMSMEQLKKMIDSENPPNTESMQAILNEIKADYEGRGFELKEVATGFRIQICQDLSPWIQKIWQEKPVKYSRALLETLALIVYRQPITRAEIEEIRGVAVSTSIIKTLIEREWIRVIGHKEIAGKPSLYATTKLFLDDFNLKSLSELPPLSELVDLEYIAEKMALDSVLTVNAEVLMETEQSESEEELAELLEE